MRRGRGIGLEHRPGDLAQIHESRLRRGRFGKEHPLVDQTLDPRGFTEQHRQGIGRRGGQLREGSGP